MQTPPAANSEGETSRNYVFQDSPERIHYQKPSSNPTRLNHHAVTMAKGSIQMPHIGGFFPLIS
jgi:hypothetical protein